MNLAVFELFNKLNKLLFNEVVQGLVAAKNGRLQDLLQCNLDSRIEFILPPGAPPYKPAMPENTEGLFWQEIRRLNIFIKGNYPTLTMQRKEFLFIEMLESIHPEDAKVLINVKDKIWPYENITIEAINTAFPGLIVGV